MSTWTKQPPTEPDHYLWRANENTPSMHRQLLHCAANGQLSCFGGDSHGVPAERIGGEWLKLIPADVVEAERQKWRAEVGKAYAEGIRVSMYIPDQEVEMEFQFSRARRVSMGEEEPSL